MPKDQVFLYINHVATQEIVREFKKIERATKDMGPCVMLYNKKDGVPISRKVLNLPHYFFTESSLSKLGTAQAFIGPMSSNNLPYISLPLVQFSREHSYQYYWYIENDVRFTGYWREFFGYFDKYDDDLLTSHIRRRAEEPDFNLWSSFGHHSEKIEPSDMLRSFNTIFRISRRALKYIDEMYCNGWVGHQEVLLPTLIFRGGFSLKDFGGTGGFVSPQDKNKYYIDSSSHLLIDGSNRYGRPYTLLLNMPKNILVHPVKPYRRKDALIKYMNRMRIFFSESKIMELIKKICKSILLSFDLFICKIFSFKLIFVLGCQRSGTTLLYMLLTAHPKITGKNECESGFSFPGSKELLRNYFNGKMTCFKLPDKTSELDFIIRNFPFAKVLWITRNPLNVVSSMKSLIMDNGNNWLEHSGLSELKRHSKLFPEIDNINFEEISQIALGAYIWKYKNMTCAKYQNSKLRTFVLMYEDLVEDPEKVLSPILNNMGLFWDDRILHHEDIHKDKKYVGNNIGDRPICKSSAKPELHLNNDEIEIINNITKTKNV